MRYEIAFFFFLSCLCFFFSLLFTEIYTYNLAFRVRIGEVEATFLSSIDWYGRAMFDYALTKLYYYGRN